MNLERSENTIDGYIRSVKIFYQKYNNISKENMLNFKKWQLEKWKPKTAHNRIVALNQYCIFLNHPEYCVKGVKIHNSTAIENVITEAEYNQMLSGLKNDGNERGYWMIKYLAKTGARVSEFIKLTKDGLLNGYCEMWTKGKIRRIYIPYNLIEESRIFLKIVNLICFLQTDTGNHLLQGAYHKILKTGLKSMVSEKKLRIHIHLDIYMQ